MTYDPGANLLKNLEKYSEFASWWTFYPDLALDLMASDSGGLKLNTDQRIFMRGGSRFFTEHGCFPRGWGKCVTGDTYVFTDRGLKQIGEFFNFQHDNIETEYLQFLNIVNWKGKTESAPFGIYSGKKPIRTIKTKEGYSLSGSVIHPVIILDKDGRIKFRKMNNLRVGDYVAISIQNELFGNKLDLDIFDDLESWVDNIPLTTHITMKPLPKKLTPELGYFFGLLMTDGCLSIKYKTLLRFKNPKILEYTKKYLKNEFQYDVVISNNGYGITNSIIRKYLELCGVKNFRLDDRKVPHVILSAPKEIQREFLRGFFDAMGNFEDSALSVVTTCKEFMKQIQMMLLNFGIISNLTIRATRTRKVCSLKILPYFLTKFRDQIGFRFFNNEDIETINKIYNRDSRIIPYQKKQISSFYFDMKEFYPEIYFTIQKIIQNDGKVRYSDIISLLELPKSKESDAYDHFKELLDCNYYFTQIDSIDRGMEHVYDLSVPDSHSFISNGFVSHNTWTEVADMFLMAIRYPNIALSLSAQTLENASKLLKDKYNEITKQYPLFLNEISKISFSKNYATIEFNNRSVIDVIANSQTTKGLRRHRINIEESNLMDNVTFDDALAPVVEVGRMTVGKLSIINPEELNQQINFFTTPGFKASSEHERSIKIYHDMVDLKGAILLGSDWMLGCWYGRGSSKSNIIKKKNDISPIAFQMNYGGTWVGSSDGALVNINRLLKCRNLSEPELESSNPSDEFYLGVDVARSQKKTNNQSSIAVGKVIRDNTGKIKEIQLSNLIHMSNTLNFTTQACLIKRVRNRYNARKIVVDGNGLGTGLIDELMKATYDPKTDEIYPAWNTINTDAEPENPRAEECLYDLKAQSAQSKILTNFIDMVDSGTLRFLESVDNIDFTTSNEDDLNSSIMPYVQEELFFQEVGNLKLIQNGKNLTVERVVRKFDKDRFSAVAYLLYYIVKIEDANAIKKNQDMHSFIKKLKKITKAPTRY